VIDEITRLRAAEVGLPAAESWPDPPLVSFPLRIDWEATLSAAGREPYPAPVVDSRAGVEPALWPGALLSMTSYALEQGWSVVQQHSRGYLPHATRGVPGKLKDWYALRMGSTDRGRRAYLTHDGTAWHSMAIWGPDVPVLTGELGVAAMHVWIAGVLDPVKFRNDLAASMRVAEKRRSEQARVSAAKRGKSGSGEGL
jgi:hypothetical protein